MNRDQWSKMEARWQAWYVAELAKVTAQAEQGDPAAKQTLARYRYLRDGKKLPARTAFNHAVKGR